MASKTNVFEKEIMIKDAVSLANKISLFCKNRIPTYVRFKLQQFQSKFVPDVERYSKMNDELIDRLSPDVAIKKYDKDGNVNPIWKQWRDEIKKVEEEKVKLKFEMLPLSMVARVVGDGGFPDELFYEDEACKKIFEKMVADAAKEKDEE